MYDDHSLRQIAERINRELIAAHNIDTSMLEADIRARTHDVAAAQIWSDNRDEIIEKCKELGISEAEFCRDYLERGESYRRMRLRTQLLQAWDRYLERRP